MSSVLSFDALMAILRSATPEQQWAFKTFVEGITAPVAPAPAPAPAAPAPAAPAPAAPAPAPAAPAAKEKKPRKATKAAEPAPVIPAAEEDKLLHPVDVPAGGAGTTAIAAPTYRLAVVNPSLCMARKIDKKAPIPGTRPEDPGSNGKFYPELQCSKKPVTGSKLCKICAEKHAEAMKPENKNKAVESYYGLLDETELYWNSQIVGSEKFNKKYPKGIPVLSNTVVITAAPVPVVTEPVKTTVLEHAPAAAEKPKKPVRKATKATEKKEEAHDETAPSTRKIPAATTAAAETSDEWELFLYEGCQYIRHKTTRNCYLVNGEEHELVRMVRRDAYEGKWRDGDLDRYAQEDEA